MSIYKNKVFIIILILIILAVGYFFWGKKLIYPPRASEALTAYNIDARGGDGSERTIMPTRTVRWENLPVAVYNKAGISYLQEVINEWNQAMGREVFKIGGQDSPVVIEIDPQISPAGKSTYQFSHYLLNGALIVLNPDSNKNLEKIVYSDKDILKDHLGHVLGFFGHTTDDPNGVMDIDHAKSNTVISSFVVSVLKELYKLPAKSLSAVIPSSRQAVKKYNIDARAVQYFFETAESVEEYKESGKLPEAELSTGTVRWRSLPVAIYDKDNLAPDLKDIINEWNQAMGREVFKIGGQDSPVVIKADAQRPPVELVVWTSKKSGLLYKVQIINNPIWVNSDKIKHQLGHALGFFGHTTDDPEGVMDNDYSRVKIISPLVVSVLKELYKLPPATEIVDYLSRSNQEVLNIRQAVKKYNIDPRGEKEFSELVRTVRWRTLPISIYNQANISNLQGILDEWNQAMGQKVFKIGGQDSPIVIEADTDQNPAPYPQFQAKTENYLIAGFRIKVNLQQPNFYYLKHQLGHALGFFGHTTDDPNGAMDQDHAKTGTVITPFVVSVLKELYYLPPAVLINF